MSYEQGTVEINNIPFTPIEGINYKHDYVKAARLISEGKADYRSVYRELILNDLWFLLYFIVKPFNSGEELTTNHPFVVQACREIEDGQKDYTLDVYAREHFKSSIITTAETIQYCLKNPDSATGIFSYIRPVAKKFLFTIKEIFQNEALLFHCFPECVYENPEKEAPLWSLDEGIILRRKSNRKEATVSAWGLVEGIPTGLHFDRRVYDDIITEDIAESVDTMEKVKVKFDSSQNLGTLNGTHRVIGTYYHHNDPLIYIRDKKDIEGKAKYLLRFKPATDTGLANGKPILLSERRFEDLKLTRTFNCQQLLNPTPEGTQKLKSEFLKEINPDMIPVNIYKFMLIDQAGDLTTNKYSGDSWAIGIVGVEPSIDDLGASNIYITDLFISPAGESEAIEQAVRMYLKGGMIFQVGVEKVGISTTHVHIQNALRAKGRSVSTEAGSLVLLRPAGRNKVKMIEAALAWPLNNGKIHISKLVPNVYKERFKMELDNFPYWHDDGLNMLAYLNDVIKDYHFPRSDWKPQKVKYQELGVV